MPLTFAHPAAVLPFSRKSKFVNFSALVLGSMSPDFEYFLKGKPSAEIGHTFMGFITFNLPLVIIVYFIYHILIHSALVSNLPVVLQDTFTKKTDSHWLLKMFVFLYSAFLGMLTHVAWDSFTHLDGFMVRNVSFLSNSVHFFGYDFPVYKILQHGSTLVGIVVIIGYMYFRAARNRGTESRYVSKKQKVNYWGQIALFTFVIFLGWYFIDPVLIESYGIHVVRMIDSALISLLIVSLYFRG